MYFYKCSQQERYLALAKANERYEGNLQLTEPTRTGSVRLRTTRGGVIGSRTSRSGKRMPYASWEAHRDFLIALFEINPNASVRTSFAHYRNKDSFYEQFPGTAYRNVGSQMEPVTMPDLTYEPQPERRLKKGAMAPFNSVVRTVRKALRTRMGIGEWDDEGDDALSPDKVWKLLVHVAREIDRINERTATEDMFGGEWLTTEMLAPLFQQRNVKWNEGPKDSVQRFEQSVKVARTYWMECNEYDIYEEIPNEAN